MIALKIAGFIALGMIVFLVATYLVMRLWNWLVPTLFNGPRLRFVHAIGLLFLTRLLVGFGGPSHGGPSHGGRHWSERWHQDGKGGHHNYCEPADSLKKTNVQQTTTYKL